MSTPTPIEQKKREAETAKAREREGSGTVPNVTPGQAGGMTEQLKELKEAVHELEEKKGDWSKSR